VAKRTKKDYVIPFTKYVKQEGVVLVVGCGTGRDLSVLASMGFSYLGIDSSKGMLNEAINNRNIRGPVLNTDLESLALVESSFDGILIDSAVEHMRKSVVEDVLEKLYKSLKIGGILLIRFRLGSGRVFMVEDVVGKRYFTSYKKSESKKLLQKNGFLILDEYCSDHMDDSRPRFHTYILRK
jgi:SAM-dependent methyltransferase